MYHGRLMDLDAARARTCGLLLRRAQGTAPLGVASTLLLQSMFHRDATQHATPHASAAAPPAPAPSRAHRQLASVPSKLQLLLLPMPHGLEATVVAAAAAAAAAGARTHAADPPMLIALPPRRAAPPARGC
jgi:hypothetical protein